METVTISGIEVPVVEVVPELRVVSALAHPMFFADDESMLAPNPELAKLVKAQMTETVTLQGEGFTFVSSVPQPDPESLRFLREFAEANSGIRVVSSILSVQAFASEVPGLVISPITTPETARLDNPLKRIFRNKWNGGQTNAQVVVSRQDFDVLVKLARATIAAAEMGVDTPISDLGWSSLGSVSEEEEDVVRRLATL